MVASGGEHGTDASRFDELIPRWLFAIRSLPGRMVATALILVATVVPVHLASDAQSLRVGPMYVVALVAIAALAGTAAVAVAGVVFVLSYWYDGVPPAGSFDLADAQGVGAVIGMVVLALVLPLLTVRIARTVRDVRALDLDRLLAVEREATARRNAEQAADEAASILALAAVLAPARTAAEVAERTLEHLDVPARPDTASIGLVIGNRLRILAAKGSTPQDIARLERVDLDQSDWLAEVMAGSPALVDDREEFAARYPAAQVLRLYPSGSWAVIPFRFEHTVGLLSFHYLTPQRLSASAEHFRLLAEIVATAIERARAQEEQAAQLAEIERNLAERDRIARTLSTSLLPPRLPRLIGFEPAGWLVPSRGDVAGDFYDLFAVDGGWVAVLGDVCGKGAEAAAVSSLARYAARTSALSDAHPPSIADTVNQVLVEDPSELTCTMGIVRFLAEPSAIDVTLAGHPQARCISDGRVLRVGQFATPLGLDRRGSSVVRHPFGPRDTIVLFSDGLIERSRSFGEDELDAALATWSDRSAPEIAGRLLELARGLDVDHADDIAVLAVTRAA